MIEGNPEIVVKPRDVMPEGARTLPARYYTDAAYFGRELDALFRTMWICAGRAEEIARPGQFVLRDVAGDSVIITRSADGGVHAFHNVCRHRGTRLCTEASGTFSGSIQCPYHAWTYGLDGRLMGAPHMDEVPHFRKEDFPLRHVHAEVWDGHLFLNVGLNVGPLGWGNFFKKI
jgi:Rieske 2Fe-2S family protein